MAMHTSHPVSALPTAPARETTGHLLLRAWCVLLLVLALGGVGLVHAVGPAATAVVVAASAVVSAIVWLVVRPPLAVRRLPWIAAGYLVWATASLAWSAWPAASVLTLLLLWITTFQGLFVGAVLTWRDVVRAIASAAKWVVGLSLLFEIAVALIVRGPLLPGFAAPTAGADPVAPWSDGALLTGGRIQGIYGDADLLAAVMLVAIIVFGVRLAAGAPRRALLIVWIAVAGFLFVRAASITAVIAAAFVALVLGTVLVMRTAKRPGERTRWYLLYAAIGSGARRRCGSGATRSSRCWAAAPTSRVARASGPTCSPGPTSIRSSAGGSRRRGSPRSRSSTAGSSTRGRPSPRRTACGSTRTCNSAGWAWHCWRSCTSPTCGGRGSSPSIVPGGTCVPTARTLPSRSCRPSSAPSSSRRD